MNRSAVSFAVIAAAILAGCGIEEPPPAEQAAGRVTEQTSAQTALSEGNPAETVLPRQPAADILTDIRLWADKSEICADDDDGGIIWYAEIPPECSPETVTLYNAETGEPAAELTDIADYEKYGGDIMGDSVYNCRYTVNTDIDTNADTSEEMTYSFYAEFTDEKGTHRSEHAEVLVYENFTDKELDDMQAVDDAVGALMEDDAFKSADLADKRKLMTALLQRLSEKGTDERPYPLVIRESIAGDDTISYNYSSGISGGVMLEDFDPMMN